MYICLQSISDYTHFTLISGFVIIEDVMSYMIHQYNSVSPSSRFFASSCLRPHSVFSVHVLPFIFFSIIAVGRSSHAVATIDRLSISIRYSCRPLCNLLLVDVITSAREANRLFSLYIPHLRLVTLILRRSCTEPRCILRARCMKQYAHITYYLIVRIRAMCWLSFSPASDYYSRRIKLTMFNLFASPCKLSHELVVLFKFLTLLFSNCCFSRFSTYYMVIIFLFNSPMFEILGL